MLFHKKLKERGFEEGDDFYLFSVTRFGKILPLWQKKIKSLWQISRVYLVFGNILKLLCQKMYPIEHIFLAVNGQMFNQRTLTIGGSIITLC